MQYSIYPGPEVLSDRSESVELRSALHELSELGDGPWLLKIDVEGAELAILESITSLFDRIQVIYLEYHSEEERLGYDRLLCDRFMLWRSSASMLHRGNVSYVAKTLANSNVRFSMWAVEPTEVRP
jgi:hypothetical protein